MKFTEGTRTSTMDEIVTERAGSILRIQLNRPKRRNAMTSAMYVALAGILNEAANDENTRVVLWHGAGDSFCAGNDLEDFLKNPPGPGSFSAGPIDGGAGQLRQAAGRRGPRRRDRRGTTMLTHCDFVYAGEST